MTDGLNVERVSYSVEETAEALGVSSRMVHDYVKDGSIGHFRMGARVLIPVDDLKAFIARRRQPPKT